MQTLQSMFPFHQIHAKVGIISWDAWGSCPCTPPPMEMLRQHLKQPFITSTAVSTATQNLLGKQTHLHEMHWCVISAEQFNLL